MMKKAKQTKITSFNFTPADEHKDNYDDNPVIDLLSDSSDEADETKLPKKSNRKSTNQRCIQKFPS